MIRKEKKTYILMIQTWKFEIWKNENFTISKSDILNTEEIKLGNPDVEIWGFQVWYIKITRKSSSHHWDKPDLHDWIESSCRTWGNKFWNWVKYEGLQHGRDEICCNATSGLFGNDEPGEIWNGTILGRGETWDGVKTEKGEIRFRFS